MFWKEYFVKSSDTLRDHKKSLQELWRFLPRAVGERLIIDHIWSIWGSGKADTRFVRGWRGVGACFQKACFLVAWSRPTAPPAPRSLVSSRPICQPGSRGRWSVLRKRLSDLDQRAERTQIRKYTRKSIYSSQNMIFWTFLIVFGVLELIGQIWRHKLIIGQFSCSLVKIWRHKLFIGQFSCSLVKIWRHKLSGCSWYVIFFFKNFRFSGNFSRNK